MTLPAGTRHAGLDRMSAGLSLVRQVLHRTVRALDARRVREEAIRHGVEASAASQPQRYDSWHAGLPRSLGD
jgi:hypothetical protein